MSYGDPHFQWLQSGSTATSAAGAHDFFGIYGGLSDLNIAEVVHLQTEASTYEFRIAPSGFVSNDIGMRITPAASMIDIPAMRVSDAKILQFANVGANNASAHWNLWIMAPL